MKLPTIHLTASEKVELKRDITVFVAAFISTGVLDGGHLTWAGLGAAVITAAKVTARKIFPHGAA